MMLIAMAAANSRADFMIWTHVVASMPPNITYTIINAPTTTIAAV